MTHEQIHSMRSTQLLSGGSCAHWPRVFEHETTMLGLSAPAMTLICTPTPCPRADSSPLAACASVLLVQVSVSDVISLPCGRNYLVDAGPQDERDQAVSYLMSRGATPTALLGLAAAVEGALASNRHGATWKWVYSPGTEEGEDAASVVLVHLDEFRDSDLALQTRLQRTVAHFLPVSAADWAAVVIEYER